MYADDVVVKTRHAGALTVYLRETLKNLRTHNIRLACASVYHPQTNGLVKRANGLVLGDIKPRLVRSLERANKKWVEKLDSVLWSLSTAPNRSTG